MRAFVHRRTLLGVHRRHLRRTDHQMHMRPATTLLSPSELHSNCCGRLVAGRRLSTPTESWTYKLDTPFSASAPVVATSLAVACSQACTARIVTLQACTATLVRLSPRNIHHAEHNELDNLISINCCKCCLKSFSAPKSYRPFMIPWRTQIAQRTRTRTI